MLALALFSSLLLVHGIDPGVCEGTLTIGGRAIPLKHAYAHLHDNTEGVLHYPRELRILLTDRPVPQSSLIGLTFLPAETMAIESKVEGLLIELDPRKPDNVVVALLTKPRTPGSSLIRTSISRTNGVFAGWRFSPTRVAGKITEKDERSPEFRTEIPSLDYSLEFSAPVFHEPKVTADLRGSRASTSVQARVLEMGAKAFARGDFAAAKKLYTARTARRMESTLSQLPPEVKKRAMAEARAALARNPKVIRVVIRGDRATAFISKNEWSSLAKENGKWKLDD